MSNQAYVFGNYQLRRQATCKKGSKTGNCSSHFNLSQEFLLLYMGYLNTLTVLPPKVRGEDFVELKIFVGKLSRVLG